MAPQEMELDMDADERAEFVAHSEARQELMGLKRTDIPMLKCVQIFHNYIKPHEGLNGDTPAERAGITVKGGDKWTTIIQNASKKRLTSH